MLATHLRTTRHAQRRNPTLGVSCGTGENLEFHRLHQVGHFDEFEREYAGPDDRCRSDASLRRSSCAGTGRQLDVERLLEHIAHQAFHRVMTASSSMKTHLDIELRELGLAIGAQILVAETAHDLVVTIEPDIISNCLNICGDCGSAKELPGCVRLGTM